jgi:hypothetical protein
MYHEMIRLYYLGMISIGAGCFIVGWLLRGAYEASKKKGGMS